MKFLTAIVFFIFVPFQLGAFESDVRFFPNIAYGKLPEQILDICQAGDNTIAKPGVIIIHAGKYEFGDKILYRSWCEDLAANGFLAVEVNYRLAKNDVPDSWWPAQLSDVQLAVRWMRAHAKELGLNPQKICAMGDSAGGHLSVLLGAPAPIVKDSNATLYADEPVSVSCVVDDFGSVDFTKALTQPLAVFGGKALADSRTWRESASPLAFITEKSAPTMIVQGYSDEAVPLEQSMLLLQALTAHNVPVEFIGYVGGHEWAGLTEFDKQAIYQKELGSFEFRVGKHDCHTRKAGIQRFLSAMRDDRLDDTPLSFPSCSRGSQGKLASGMTSSLTHSKLERAKN